MAQFPAQQKPPDLDEQGNPVTELYLTIRGNNTKPPDLDSTGKPITAETQIPPSFISHGTVTPPDIPPEEFIPDETEPRFGTLRNIGAMGIRGVSAFVPGGPMGALVGGLGEAIAQTIEPRESYNFPQMAVQAGLGTIPFGRVASIGRGMLKGGALGLSGTTGTELAESGELPSLGQAALGTGLGAIGGGIAGKFVGKGQDIEFPTAIIPKPRIRPMLDGTFKNLDTEEIFDKSGNPIKSVTEKLREVLGKVPEKIKEQEGINVAERAEKFVEVGKVTTPGKAGFYEELGKLKGEHPKVTIDSLKLTPDEADNLFDDIKKIIPDKPTSIRARGAIEKLLNGEVPQQNELDLLEDFLSVSSGRPRTPRNLEAHSKLREWYELARGLMSVDMPFMTSATFRQTNPLAFSRRWFQAYGNAARAFNNSSVYDNIINDLEKSPIHVRKFVGSEATSIGKELGLAWSDLRTLTGREEQIRSILAEKIPVWGKYVRANNRAFTAFQNIIRTRTAEDWLKAAGAIDARGNLIDKVTGQKLVNTLNELTGHGSLKIAMPIMGRLGLSQKELNLEKAADALSLVLWNPRLLVRDARMMNPLNYIATNKLDRMKYLEGAVRRAGVWAGFTGLAYLAGASINSDPTSSDFGKAKIGDTRLDAGSGLLQWIVLSAREALGESTSSSSKRTTELGSSAIARTRWDVASEFLENRIHPTLGIPFSAMSATKNAPFYPLSETAERITPIPAGDILELIKSDPEIEQIIMGLVGSSLSMGASTYGAREYGKPQFEIPGDVPFEGGKFFGR